MPRPPAGPPPGCGRPGPPRACPPPSHDPPRSRPRRGGRRPPSPASNGTRPRASSPPIMPVSTSPEPAVASTGLPVGFTRAMPSGAAITVRLPFSSTTASARAASARACASRSDSSSRAPTPARRANSPTCGVRTASAFRSARSSARPAKAFSASASTTAGTGQSRSRSRTKPAVSSWAVMPGPIASAWARPSASRTGSRASAATPPSAVSGSGRKTASVIEAWSTGTMPCAAATTTSPAPIRPAASAIRWAAPVIPREPATTTSTPEARLCVSTSRRGTIAATSSGSVTNVSARSEILGEADVHHADGPRALRARQEHDAALAAPNVTVRSLRTASPSTAPVAPFTPEGMSTATTGGAPAFNPSIAAAHRSSGTPRNPVPKTASTATSARASSRASRDSVAMSTREAHLREPREVRRGGLAEPVRRFHREHRDAHAPAREVTRRHEPVAAVVPLAADHDRATPVHAAHQVDAGARHRAAGALHQRGGGHAARLGGAVELGGLRGREHRLQRALTPPAPRPRTRRRWSSRG